MRKLKDIPSGYDGVWVVVRALKRFTVSDVLGYVAMTRNAVQQYLGGLEKAGYLDCETGRFGAKIYDLKKDVGIHRPRISSSGKKLPTTNQQKMWMAIKALGQFTASELALAAQVGISIARNYCRVLSKAGYLNFKAGRGGQPSLYWLKPSMDHGPKAPESRKDGTVYDQNLRKVVYRPEGVMA